MDVFLTSPWIPAEWIRAHGLMPRGIGPEERFQNFTGSPTAGVCGFAEAAVRQAVARTDAAVIFSTACDQMRRGFDTVILREQRHAFLFNLPATWQTATAKEMFRSELERLGKFLMTLGGEKPTPNRLRQEMERSSAVRNQLLASAAASPPRGFAEAVARFHWDGVFSPPPAAPQENLIPLALIGGPFLAAHWKLLDEIEAAGGRVALNATKTGERSLCPAFALDDAGDPLDALVHGYCDHIVDVFQRPNTRLYSWLKPRLEARQVRGMALWHFTGCDLWRAEAETLRETFGLPLLLLEAGSEPGNTPRELTRLQAFVEMLKAEG